MLEAIERILNALTPLLVALVAAYGGVLVAKVNKVQKDTTEAKKKVEQVQKDIITNHGSKNIGDAIDRLWEKLLDVSKTQDGLVEDVKSLKDQDRALDERLDVIEHAAEGTKEAVSGSIRVVRPFQGLIDKITHKEEE
ncbi:membrane protein [Microbacterium phage McGalleon]|uniref:Membrane protein n=1 Tax=Microbacterium phage McGalleon TaxID=2590936 RepID=A0A516KQV7_9CAUD|nr:membrane protein [Microbacterium phage McGalleon]QDP44078.1 membrane protein [Microbacterium phage McGalleon]